MNRLFKVAIVLSAFGLFAPTPARSEWVSVTNTSDTIFQIDDSSLLDRSPYIQFVEPHIYKRTKNGVAFLGITKLMDCRTGNWTVMEAIKFGPTGQLLARESKSPIYTTRPNTIGEDIYSAVCASSNPAQDYWRDTAASREFINNLWKN